MRYKERALSGVDMIMAEEKAREIHGSNNTEDQNLLFWRWALWQIFTNIYRRWHY
jgi:hypothetical protein